MWPGKPKLFTFCPFKEKVYHPYPRHEEREKNLNSLHQCPQEFQADILAIKKYKVYY